MTDTTWNFVSWLSPSLTEIKMQRVALNMMKQLSPVVMMTHESWLVPCKLWFLSYPTHARGAGYYHLTGPTDVNHETWIMIYSTFKLPKTCSALTWVVMPLNPLGSWEKLALLAYQHRNVHPPSSPKHLEILWPTDGPRITVNIF